MTLLTESAVIELKDVAKENGLFRKVLFTGAKSQLVIMSLLPGEEIGAETHDGDQIIYAVKGDGVAVLDDTSQAFEKGTVFCVPAGSRHNVINTGADAMKLFTVYAPPQHRAGASQATKSDPPHELS
jgi:mannose-6-phosphate isomerase-like protein (cupin superfamily)